MKIIHIESGLGNQMLSYCEYLAIKKMNPEDVCYIETVVFDIPECNEVINQWNGYELARIFGINAPNIKDVMSKDQWDEFLRMVRDSDFWHKNWNYPVYITQALNNVGIPMENLRGDFEKDRNVRIAAGQRWYAKNILYAYYRRYIENRHASQALAKCGMEDKMFVKTEKNIFLGQQLGFRLRNSGIERIDKEIREAFVFPVITDERNGEALSRIKASNAVAVHVRRGDGLSFNYSYIATGYYKRAVKYIKQYVADPSFFIFCDPTSVEWCKKHEATLGLNMNKDKVYFIDWNKGENSWRDMQLMAQCQHNVCSNSSFAWWGAYLNNNPDKITTSPKITINTTHHF